MAPPSKQKRGASASFFASIFLFLNAFGRFPSGVSSSGSTTAMATTRLPSLTRMSRTPWVNRDNTEIWLALIRMMVPSWSIITRSSSPDTTLSPATGPVFWVTLRVLIPIPPRFCRVYSDAGVSLPYPFSLMVSTNSRSNLLTSKTSSPGFNLMERTPSPTGP